MNAPTLNLTLTLTLTLTPDPNPNPHQVKGTNDGKEAKKDAELVLYEFIAMLVRISFQVYLLWLHLLWLYFL